MVILALLATFLLSHASLTSARPTSPEWDRSVHKYEMRRTLEVLPTRELIMLRRQLSTIRATQEAAGRSYEEYNIKVNVANRTIQVVQPEVYHAT